MKAVMILIVFLFSFQLNAQTACKCNCDPTDRRLCASLNDLEHPCQGLCGAPAPGLGPMLTACPVTKVTDRATGVTTWVSLCH
ncbi:hypothetical protein [Legionella fallonii]|uniref:hypothetical protein n=1 Tax=Legionella fallonii TaxID=96230 RepID=UPI0005D45B3C|nr:hypothetical protein [Legionella fallonii]